MDYLSYSKNYLMNTYGQFPVVFTHGKGCKLYDTEEKEYLDLTSGIGVSSLGYGNEEWIKAVTDQAKNLAHISNIFLNIPELTLAKKLTEASGMSKVFFGNSGAEANEGSIKLARKYSYLKYGKGRSTILTLNKSFHGRTITTLKATGQEKFHKYFDPFTEGFKYTDVDVKSLEAAIDPTVCAIMMEAIQGEGGVYPLPKEFIDKVFEISKKKDILVIFDEVQCGMGRTGKLFGYMNYGVEPDIVSTAKGLAGGLPIGAVLCNKKLENTFVPGDHGSTFGGNPISTAGANCVVDTLKKPGFLDDVAKKGAFIKNFFKKASSKNVLEIRGIGLMLGIQLNSEKSSEVQKKALENGILVLTAGSSVVRLLPPLVISEQELESVLSSLVKIIDEI
ncbi:acetylornithine/succinylornithine family transaminase [Clostridium tyrobutyricum]|jgi:acetylornithine/N-succinyldiaminopimelate aminotransferase|uniref:Acetylornithine aminotransferase n=1 Tax=Clostridium tyrobutyricum DIVETGP TaxID=1408889 RepID=W6NFY0_CLOTY|nr:aspartate aminotransferase family protein [Clostridium tyrobutyricum]AND84463.1 acetylornithine aminotransferase [Clostridium tyrobutyricum]ANP69078.1 acetylornithine aminotransferase [Clostridium tyrobutyricum]MBR9647573.1 aspartate aminotransferase family protein [Clostridium tyrobutyricum]MBV4416743.1 aspartate aminotransferase family protein [Clostridium tyrobutyricum]MBV4422765.1 aspartate aminotransferase family protein [Clostridium tyrobutyricum]